MKLEDIAALAQPSDSKVVLLVLDGLGGLPRRPGGKTELESAVTQNLDELASEGTCGLHIPVAPGLTPGSGPGHLALFGYDPLLYRTGRGVLEALGVGFNLGEHDIAVRANFCTLDGAGRILDRRAGRIESAAAAKLAERLADIALPGASTSVRHVSEHRFVLLLHPDEPCGADVCDTDPGRIGEPPGSPVAAAESSEPAAALLARWLDAAGHKLAGERTANGVLFRGVSKLPDWPTFPDVFGMRAVAAAAYPMYRGVSRLVGMEAVAIPDGPGPLIEIAQERLPGCDFLFLHHKAPDKAGEDGDFDRKVAAIEEMDAAIPGLVALEPDILLITGDHSTPATMASHSWHPVPFLLWGGPSRRDPVKSFGETACGNGTHGIVRGCDLMPLAAARGGRLAKFGA